MFISLWHNWLDFYRITSAQHKQKRKQWKSTNNFQNIVIEGAKEKENPKSIQITMRNFMSIALCSPNTFINCQNMFKWLNTSCHGLYIKYVESHIEHASVCSSYLWNVLRSDTVVSSSAQSYDISLWFWQSIVL